MLGVVCDHFCRLFAVIYTFIFLVNDGSSSVPGIPQEHHTKTLLDDDNMIPEDEKDNNMDEFSIHVEQLTASNSTVTSSTTQSTAPIDSPCDPSSSSIDRGIDPLNLLDQEFLSSKDPREWSVQEVMDFMTAIGCPAHAPSFQKQVTIVYLETSTFLC